MFALAYHEATKHHFNRFARSAGYLDWGTQPDPFRRFAGAPLVPLPHEPLAAPHRYASLYDHSAEPLDVTLHAVGELLRCALGLSAWKQYQTSRWALRVNPSSGNLHPTEAYVVWDGAVSHYAPREHALEQRCVLPPDRPPWLERTALVALTSIFWREAWKYGERAFRYCQHDAGHALAALRLSAARLGWDLRLLAGWADADIDGLLGLDRQEDFGDAERESAECIAIVGPRPLDLRAADEPTRLVAAGRRGRWAGRANALSPSRVSWPIVDRVAAATIYPGASAPRAPAGARDDGRLAERGTLRGPDTAPDATAPLETPDPTSRALILQRRSAVAFDPRSPLAASSFVRMLRRVLPGAPPWDAMDWPPQVHLAIFVHRVEGLAPGLYAFMRDPAAVAPLRAAMRPEFLWEPHAGETGSAPLHQLFLLLPLDVTWAATRLSCDQDIAGDGFFSLAMMSCFEPALSRYGEWFYRRLFWECGAIGQVLYLEAEAAGGRGTGIGCFYDDPVHEALGLSGRAWQSLYHFSMGVPIDDVRLTTDAGYTWG